jgi:putative mRNA 3-end processing factor
MGLVTFTDKGLYCKQGDFYIDPWLPVHRAVTTHAHSDHARYGSNLYLAHTDSFLLLKARLGQDISIQSAGYNQVINVNGVNISFHPAGHVIGSAQARLEYKGEVWVVSGDYKLEDDGLTIPFEPVKCNTFITESTFGLPIYQWKPQAEIMTDIHNWVQQNQQKGRYSVLSAYSLGKAQRLIHALSTYGYKFYVHGAVYNMHTIIQQFMQLPDVTYLTPETPKDEVKQGIIITPSSDTANPWLKRWSPYSFGVCSGWMQVRGAQRRRNADSGFALSDHADWEDLVKTIKATGAETIYVTHGFSDVLARYAQEELGLKAGVVKTRFGEDEE